jgi:hypothetical protein
MIPLLWKLTFFDRCHHTGGNKCLGTGRRRNCTTKREKSKGKGRAQRALALAGLLFSTIPSCRSAARGLSKKNLLHAMNEDYISIVRCPDQNKIRLQLVFSTPLGDFKDRFLDDRGELRETFIFATVTDLTSPAQVFRLNNRPPSRDVRNSSLR